MFSPGGLQIDSVRAACCQNNWAMEFRVADLRAAFDFWTVKHPLIQSFKFEDHATLGSWNFAVSSVVLYLLAVLVLKVLLSYRDKPFRLGFITVVHNLVLVVGSLMMFVGCLNAALIEARGSSWMWGKKKSLEQLEWVLCFPRGTRAAGPVFFWSYVYYLSKFYELLDTVILLFKKRSLSFLHVFHHAAVIFMCFFWLLDTQSLQIIALLTNTAVHVIMYTYYFLCSINCPPPWKKVVTNLQIVQFVFSFICGVATLWLHFSGPGCAGMYAFSFNLVFNASLLFLFLNFHSKQYGAASGNKVSKGSTAGRTRRSLQARKQK